MEASLHCALFDALTIQLESSSDAGARAPIRSILLTPT